MDVNEHERLSNTTLRHKLKLRNSAFIAVLHFCLLDRIFLLGRLIFSVSINSHPDNIYLFSKYNLITSFIFLSNLVFNIRAVPDH